MQGKLIVLLACLMVASYAQTRCWNDYSVLKKGVLSSCVDGCRDYPTLDAAAEACDKNSLCEGVSNEFKSNGGSNSIGPNALVGWQLRKGSLEVNYKYNQQGYTFLKGTEFCNIDNVMYGGPIFDYSIEKSCVEKTCATFNNWLNAAQSAQKLGNGDASVTLKSDGKSWAPYKNQQMSADDYAVSFFVSKYLNTEYTSSKNQYYDEKRGYSFKSCYNNCKDYASLKEAQYYCNQTSECEGITYQHIDIDSGSKSVGYILGYGYQLRKGALKADSGVISYAKQVAKADNPVKTTTSTPTTTPTETTTPTTTPTTTTTPTNTSSPSSGTETVVATPTTTAPTETVTPIPTTTPTDTSSPSTGTTGADTNNNSSSSSTTNPVECPVLYKECYYAGESVKVCESNPDFNWHLYKSMTIPDGQYVIIYEKDNYLGEKYYYDISIPCADDVEFFLQKNKKSFAKEEKSQKHQKKNHHKLKKNE